MSDDAPTAVERPGAAIADTEPVVGDRRSGTAFSERYEPGAELGRGGMGCVVEATDRMLGRVVALKLALDTASNDDALRRFARETQITARLEHPSIVPVYDAGVTPDGSPFYVMRKVTGRPLDKLVGAAERLDDRLALVPNVVAACQAVAHAHERGIIHRDLKPSNILVGARGETMVIDWGLAKVLDEHDEPKARSMPSSGESLRTRVGMVFGTPGFMAPEQLASSDVDERADVYALGATLFHVLARRPPHQGKSVEEIEEAARAQPPPPIASLVPGVPRELSTIVDTALAYDLGTRYRNAGVLAEELSRFMTGQLVASHAYSTRERLARFVRRNRALVITIAAALSVLAVGSWIAVGRVVAARDEAIAQARTAELARAREADRASDLVISQARLLLASNPAAAVAMVRPLAATDRWREVRAIAAGARAAGVPWHLPGPSTVSFTELSSDGMRAVVCGGDGSIHLYNLGARTHTVIAKLTGRVRATFADPTHVVAWVDSAFTIIDTGTRATRTLARPTPIRAVAGHDGIVYFTDEQRRAWRLDIATGEEVAIAVPGEVSHVVPSPDGKRVALAGDHLWLLETRRPELVEKIRDGKTFEIAWSTDGDRLAALGQRSTYVITVHPEIEVDEYTVTNHALVLARGVLYTTGLSGFTIGDRVASAADLATSLAGLYATRGEFVVGAGRTALRVFDGDHEHQVPLPATPLTVLRASPHSPYILVVAAERVLLWNIEHIMPARVEVPSYAQIATIGPHTAWTLGVSGGARAIDLRTGETRELPKLPPLRYAAPASGSYLIARPLSGRETQVFDRDGRGEPVPVDALSVEVLDDRRAVLATRDHRIVLYDIATRQVTPLGSFGGTINRVLTSEANPRWIVATLEDGTVWRHDLASGAAATTRIAARTEAFSPGLVTTTATAGGDVFFASGARLRRWKLDGSVEDHVVLPRPIRSVERVDDARAIVVVDDGTGYLVRLGHREQFARLPPLGAGYTFAPGLPIIVSDDRTGGVTVIDLDANAAWKIAHATPQGSTPAISGDASFVVLRDASLDSSAVALWHLDLPTTPAATAAWIEGLTNATFDPRTGMIGWAP